jgi:transposase
VATDKKIALENDWDIVWMDESGFMLQPVVRRTWAPVGETPIHYSWDRHDRISACAAIQANPKFESLQVYFELWMRNIKAEDVLSFLKEIHQETGKKLIIILDRWNGHRKAIRLLLEENVDWLQVEWLPAYAPELNPVEQLWGHTKYGDLANYIPEDIQTMYQSVTNSLQKAGTNSKLLLSFVRHTHLNLC